MQTTSSAIPVIDISRLATGTTAERAGVARAIGAACRDIGFFAVTGHGVAPAVVADAFRCAHAVFALPASAKTELAIGRHGHNRGYVGLGVERLDETTAADCKEAYNLIWNDPSGGADDRPANVWPDIDGWRVPMQTYFETVLAVGKRLHRAFALDLGLADESFFDTRLDRPMATLRLLHYPTAHAGSTDRDNDPGQGQPGAGTHTDYGNVTLLATDGVAGLQVRRRDGAWIDAPHLPDAFICNIGDCLMRWTNKVYVSTPHRVLPPASERYSIAFFLDPNPDAWVSALEPCVPPGASPHYGPIMAAEYLRQRLDSTYKA